MVGGPLRGQTRRMTLPTVVEITPQPEAVTPDPFIDGLPTPARADLDRAVDRTIGIADRSISGRD
jgi:hypothetical protein